MRTGIVYTETVVHAAAERFAAEAPFQVAIVDLEGGERVTARISGDCVAIGDRVLEIEALDQPQDKAAASVPHFRKS